MTRDLYQIINRILAEVPADERALRTDLKGLRHAIADTVAVRSPPWFPPELRVKRWAELYDILWAYVTAARRGLSASGSLERQ